MNSRATDAIVSVIMPVRDVVATVGSAVQSIRLQTFEDWELLILDDGSTDGTLDLLHRFELDSRVRVLADGLHLGLPRRINQALTIAEGRFVARMDGDDISYPERLELQLEFMETHPEVDLVGSPMFIIGDDGQTIGQRSCPTSHAQICARPGYGFRLFHPTFFGRTAWFRRYGYDPRSVRCEDQDLLLRSYLRSRFANLPEVLLAYREERVRLLNALRGRWHYTRAIARHERNRAGSLVPARILTAAAQQIAKGTIETVAVTMHVERSLLGHRARAASVQEEARWRAVREMVAAQDMSL